jgi:hypothetical protein
MYKFKILIVTTFALLTFASTALAQTSFGLRPKPISNPPVSQKQNCSPSYPDVCIPPPPPDLDCKDISYRKFKVLEADPHKFDQDKNGIGCEKKSRK